MKKLAIILATILALTTMIAMPVTAKAPWSLAGSAVAVKEGNPPNPWAIELTSTFTPPSTYTYGNVEFAQPQGGLTFAGIYQLSTDYKAKVGGIGGGSIRFQLAIDTDGDGAGDGKLHVYIGPLPNFVELTDGWKSTGNLIAATDARYDLTQFGGPFYGTYAQALAMLGSDTVVGISLVADAGWFFPAAYRQVVLVDNVTVNQHMLSAKGFSK